jgi:hypothetical protein
MPCPACGSAKRTITLFAGNPQPSNYVLDNYVAHKLSDLTECGAVELEAGSPWLNLFILNSIFSFNVDPKTRAYLFSFLRRTEGATTAYQLARTALTEYIRTPSNVISPYFTALTQFEICISQIYQGCLLLAEATGQRLYEKGDGSVHEKLNAIYIGSKHMDKKIPSDEFPDDATTGVWITNLGLESSCGDISFLELHELLITMHSHADLLSSTMREVEGSDSQSSELENSESESESESA